MTKKLLEIQSPWSCQPGVVRILPRANEPAVDALAKRQDGQGLVRPYIFETPTERRLHFTQEATQSAMSLRDPDTLVAQYTRKMMSFLLMNPDPRHIIMLGLGGGSLAKFCYRYLPDTRITVIEIDADVIALRDEFMIPKDDARFRVIHDDGARFLEHTSTAFDALLVDAFDEIGVATSLANPRFYAAAARGLVERGVLVMNLWGKPERLAANIEAASAQFGQHALLVTVMGELNVLLFASHKPPPKSITGELEVIADRLQQELRLDFPRYLRRLCQGQTLLRD